MKLSINGKSFEITVEHQDASINLATVLSQFDAKPPFAVALNGEFVANNNYRETQVTSQDKVDVVSPIFGG